MIEVTKETIKKLSCNNEKISRGIKSILDDNIYFRSFERSLILLANAKDENALQAVEAGIQVTINEVRSLHDKRSPYMTHEKAARYLSVLQYIIFHLNEWTFKNGKENNYVPQIIQKLDHLINKGAELGIEFDVIQRECFSSQYQIPNHEDLDNFRLLDEQKMDSLSLRMKRYLFTQNPQDFFERHEEIVEPKLSHQTINRNNYHIVEKILFLLKQKLNVQEIDLNYFFQNKAQMEYMLAQVTGNHNPEVLAKITSILSQYLTAQNSKLV